MALNLESELLLRYSPFNSFVNPSFWHKLTQIKLDVDRLTEKFRPIWGYYYNTQTSELHSSFHVDCSSYNEEFEIQQFKYASHGIFINVNTLEKFKSFNKSILINHCGAQLWESIKDGSALDTPVLLSRFVILIYADLKKHLFYYWFAFPSPNFPPISLTRELRKLSTVLNAEQLNRLVESYMDESDCQRNAYFLIRVGEVNVKILPLRELRTEDLSSLSNADTTGLYIGFADPCNLPDNPGWPLRNLMALLMVQCPSLIGCQVRVLCLRLHMVQDSSWSASESILLEMVIPSVPASDQPVSFVGWERNVRGQYGPRAADLSSSMNPIKLAEGAVDLNLKLMKWKLLPELDLDKIHATKCLLLGSGTLGCSVARTLLGWGVRTITLVDNGQVSYSNPVRQSLFTYEDSLRGGKPKSAAAADALRAIYPGINSNGIQLNIPMPGHPISDSLLDDTKKDVVVLEDLIENHDVVFLLTDSRESRWLPTVIGAAKGKIVMNAALGFDSYLVMRHGLQTWDEQGVGDMPATSRAVPGNQLGCYFCNDVTAPGNSQNDRTLDQQCTVARPGISAMAGALLVELFISLLHHPLCGGAPADLADSEESGCLGLIPHSIRGFLSRFQHLLLVTHKFSNCVACSDKVIEEYKTNRFEFLLKVFNRPNFLEDVSGLKWLQEECNVNQMWELSDSD